MELEKQVQAADQNVAAETAEKKDSAVVVDFKMVTFALSGKDYAIDIMNVKEIAKAGRFTYVPNTLPFVLGVYNLRGEIIPILDLRLFFNIEVPQREENKLENLLILNVGDQKFGVVVDKIDKVVGVQKSTIQPPHPLFGDINIKYINGVVESNNRLYVLLDVSRIFSAKDVKEQGSVPAEKRYDEKSRQPVFAEQNVRQKPAADASAEDETKSKNLKFIAESLLNYRKFYVSPVNSAWIGHRYDEWLKERGADRIQLQNENDADEFLKPFWSSFSGKWWSKDFAENVEKLLPDNSARQIVVWNPGCGKGMETYSLACVLKKRYPDAKIRIYAQDIDLLNVSNAALLSVPSQLSGDWYAPYLGAKANGEPCFSQEIRDSVMFEYHDCKNTNALPMVDVIFARDILSMMDEKSVETVISDFQEKMKGNAVAIIGENEVLPPEFKFGENSSGSLVAYTKD